MSQLVKDRFTRLLDSAIVVVGTKEIVPAMVFKRIGRYSAYVEHYYMHTPHVIILMNLFPNHGTEPTFLHGEKSY